MDEELIGLRIHKYSHGSVRIPEHETHSTLIDSVLESAQELSEKINPLLEEYKLLSKRLNALHKKWRFET